LPKTFINLSFTWGIIFLIFFGFFNWWTFNLLAYVCNKYKCYDYAKLIKKILGEKVEYLYSFAIILSCGITMIAYINIGNFFNL
jgi:amino acid permease